MEGLCYFKDFLLVVTFFSRNFLIYLIVVLGFCVVMLQDGLGTIRHAYQCIIWHAGCYLPFITSLCERQQHGEYAACRAFCFLETPMTKQKT